LRDAGRVFRRCGCEIEAVERKKANAPVVPGLQRGDEIMQNFRIE
jgi:hypothetical protein